MQSALNDWKMCRHADILHALSSISSSLSATLRRLKTVRADIPGGRAPATPATTV